MWKKNILKYVQKLQEQTKRREERIKRQEEKLKELVKRREEHTKRREEKLKEQTKLREEKLKQKLQKKITKALTDQTKKWNKQQLKEFKKQQQKETAKWEKEIKKESKRQFAFKEGLKWKGAKRLGNVREKLNKKLWGVFNEKIKTQKLLESLQPIRVSRAIKKNTEKWIINGNEIKDPKVFLDGTSDMVENLINKTDSVGKKVNTVLVCKMVKSDPITGDKVITICHFRSVTKSIISKEDSTTEYIKMRNEMLENISKFQKEGSGWRLHSVENLEIFITKYKPLNGKSYKPLPKELVGKKAIINIKNGDDMCFKWAVTRALNPVEKDGENITKLLKKQSENLNWDGVKFPTDLKNITMFEKKNEISINVFGYDDDPKIKKVFPLRISQAAHETNVKLFLYDEHYSVVKNMSRLFSSQISKKNGEIYICIRCLNSFGSQKLLENHKEICDTHDHQRHVYPNEGDKIFFKQYKKTTDMPFVIYADFESFILPIDTVQKNNDKSHTTAYQKHEPSGFCYTIKCFDESIYKDKTVLYTMEKEGEDIGKKFVESVEKDMKEIYNIAKVNKPIIMSENDEKNFKNAKECYACKEELNNDRVRDHCHFTGKYRGAAHNNCNVKMKKPTFIPVLFHNLEGYDSHLFIKSLGLSEGRINCIPKTDEKYISFSKDVVMKTITNKKGKKRYIKYGLRFLDSLKFTLSSLDSLVGNLGNDQLKNGGKRNG